MKNRDGVCTRAVQTSSHCRSESVEASLLTDRDPPTKECLGQMPQLVSVPHRAHEL